MRMRSYLPVYIRVYIFKDEIGSDVAALVGVCDGRAPSVGGKRRECGPGAGS